MSELIRKLKEKKYITKVKFPEDISDELISKEIPQVGSVKIVAAVKEEIGPVRPPYAVMRETNPELMDVCVKNKWAANNDYMTYEEAAAITNEMINSFSFNNVVNLEEFRYFTGITSLSNSCFSNCYNLTSIEIPSSVTSIGNYCFANCPSLASIKIPDSLTQISNGCFSNCYNLTSIEIPSSVTSIGNGCFEYCGKLSLITCLATTAPTVTSNTFGDYYETYVGNNTSASKILKIPTGATGYDTGAWKDPLQNSSKCGFTIEYI